MAEDLLSDLCTICHVDPHRYCCPRCTARTCSLVCAKKHKARSQCNGVRDPTTYIRHAALLTPKGLDNDFNYLTSVERKLSLAHRDAVERGVDQVGHGTSTARGTHPGGMSRLERLVQESGAIVQRAPSGLARARTNRTKLYGKKKDELLWTVEWVHPDGTSRIGNCRASQPISDAFNAHVKHAAIARACTQSGSKQGGARSPPESTADDQSKITILDVTEPAPRSRTRTNGPVMRMSKDVAGNPEAASLYFYLHLPRQPSRRPVLRALGSDSTPASFLRGRLIIEYPTIYVLQHASSDLPSHFIHDDKFFKNRGREDTTAVVKSSKLEDGEIDEVTRADLNDEKLEKLGEVLSQDLEGWKGMVGIHEVVT